jgi:chitinase
VDGAHVIWETFGPPKSGSSAYRPFGNASIDGLDIDFETTVTNTLTFAQELRKTMDSDGSDRPRFLTAAPQCPYPDLADQDILHGDVKVDAIWVQFYNNYCGLDSFQPSAETQEQFNFATWDNWAKNVSYNPDVRVMMGVPASPTAAGSGYTPPGELTPIIQYAKSFDSFGGVMMWDVTQAYANEGFLDAVNSALRSSASRIMRSVVDLRGRFF